MLDWLTPFSLATGAALLAGYALLGATWLIMKTAGPLQAWARRASLYLLAGVLLFMGVVSLWVPFLNADIAARWFSWPNLLYLSPVPILVAGAAAGLYLAVRRQAHALPFLLAMLLFLLGYAGLGISLFPSIIPPDISIWAAASPPESQVFLLVGMAVLVPTILAYTAYTYWIFRGKVTAGAGYH
jgi:cytochrome d ubiquinol oxidase subunit II